MYNFYFYVPYETLVFFRVLVKKIMLFTLQGIFMWFYQLVG